MTAPGRPVDRERLRQLVQRFHPTTIPIGPTIPKTWPAWTAAITAASDAEIRDALDVLERRAWQASLHGEPVLMRTTITDACGPR